MKWIILFVADQLELSPKYLWNNQQWDNILTELCSDVGDIEKKHFYHDIAMDMSFC